jgi:tRNA G18 (ribose-2'-O)-methylase SpoU
MEEITDIEDPRVKFYRSLRYTPKSHTDARVFIAEGEKPVVRLLKSNLRVHSVFATKEFFENYRELLLSKEIEEKNLFFSTKELMEKIVGFHLHTGIMAIGYQPDDIDIDKFSDIVVGLNCINNAENVGLIVRNCKAFGVDSLLVDEHSTSPFLRRAVRVSMGNVFTMSVRHSKNFVYELKVLKELGFAIVGAEVYKESTKLWGYKFPKKVVVLFGNEANGLDNYVIDVCDDIVQIPISSNVDSLNVGVSVGILLYELNRQRNEQD